MWEILYNTLITHISMIVHIVESLYIAIITDCGNFLHNLGDGDYILAVCNKVTTFLRAINYTLIIQKNPGNSNSDNSNSDNSNP